MIAIKMPDNSFNQYDEHFIITDKANCVVCMGKFYHTSLDCECLTWERSNSDNELRGMTINEAKSLKMVYCADCSRDLYLYNHERLESK